MKNIVIIGAGGFGREVAWLIKEINDGDELTGSPKFNLLGFIDDNPQKTHTVEKIPVLGNLTWLINQEDKPSVVCAVGDPRTRYAIIQKLEKNGFDFPTLISPTIQRSNHVEIGKGTVICTNCVLTTNIIIGQHVILNLACTVGHDSVIEDFASVMPGVMIAGDVNIGKGAYLGIGSNIINLAKIGDWSIIGSGATVIKDIPPNVTAVGTPATPIKQNG